ncbi:MULTISPECIES: GNAT family N-acetyltransferase [unclassified Sphingobacterium]|uniref:GNAT family N-acetyltransferase n=1 Tax=unclassified Sphingobacterium TaxID=2609468 RepID=UPI0025E87358|nr:MULTISPECIES: GNAT family N-acetyltransferase [unclassified Sphingobacterium]
MPDIRTLDKDEIFRIKEIDRSEEIAELYIYRNGSLLLIPHRETVSGFDPAELREITERQLKLISIGGVVYGAFDQEKLVGVASVEYKPRGVKQNYRKMDILYVSHAYQGKGTGRQLLNACKKSASDFGADKLYISAIPTRNTIDFYLKNGAILTTELDKELFTAEPQDIHLEMDLSI